MSFGVGDLFGILAGGAFVTKEAIKEIGERAESEGRTKLIQAYISESTDIELEKKLKMDIEDPKKYAEVWERIESYKRDNPTTAWCKTHKATGKKCYPGFSLIYCRSFDVADIGKRRIPFRDAKGGLFGRNQTEEAQLHDNREIALSLLMWTYGKETVNSARKNAENIYPITPSKHQW